MDAALIEVTLDQYKLARPLSNSEVTQIDIGQTKLRNEAHEPNLQHNVVGFVIIVIHLPTKLSILGFPLRFSCESFRQIL